MTSPETTQALAENVDREHYLPSSRSGTFAREKEASSGVGFSYPGAVTGSTQGAELQGDQKSGEIAFFAANFRNFAGEFYKNQNCGISANHTTTLGDQQGLFISSFISG